MGSWHSRRRDGPVALQSRRVPDLGLDGEGAELHRPGAELHPYCCASIIGELVFGEAGQQVALSYTRFTNQHHWRRHTHTHRYVTHSSRFWIQGLVVAKLNAVCLRQNKYGPILTTSSLEAHINSRCVSLRLAHESTLVAAWDWWGSWHRCGCCPVLQTDTRPGGK